MFYVQAFVFLALLEFTFVNYLWRRIMPPRQAKGKIQETGGGGSGVVGGGGGDTTDVNGDLLSKQEQSDQPVISVKVLSQAQQYKRMIRDPLEPTSNMIRARQIDEYSRLCFPLLFALFNVCYWWYYLR